MRKTLCFAVVLTVLILHAAIGMKQNGPDSERNGTFRKSSSNLKKNSQSSGSLKRGQSGLNSAVNKSGRKDYHNARAIHPRASASKADVGEQSLIKRVFQGSLNGSGRLMSLSSNGRGGRSPRRHLHLRKHKSPDGRMLLQLHTSGWTKLHKIEINYGDIVVCHTHTYGTFKRPKTHFFLAVSGHELQHVYPIPGDPSERGVIVIEDKAKIPHKFHSFLDCDSCKNLGNGRYDKQATSLRAEKWVDRYTFYNEDSCASYHWVVYWVTGRVPEPKIYIPGFNPRLNMVCRLKNIKTSPEPLGTDTKISDETLSKLATISDEDVLAEIFKNESNQSDTESTGRYSDNGIAIEHP